MKRIFFVMLTLGALLVGGSVSQAATGATGATGARITDLGTLGGSFSAPLDINARGQVTGVSVDASETALLAFVWSRGRMTPLPGLGGPQTGGAGINDRGNIAGFGELTTLAPASIFNQTQLFCNPPMVNGQPAVVCRATLWRNGIPVDLGTLGGLNSTTSNRGINNRDQVVGAAETTQPDPTGIPGAPRFHAFVWQRGHMTDLGTLGSDPDSNASDINEHGQVVGVSIPDGASFNGRNSRAFLWQRGRIHALPGLGGTYSSATSINNRGDIVGAATLAGNTARHAVLWTHGRPTDLGTLPGDVSSEAVDLVGRDLIVGSSCGSRDAGPCRATLWLNGRAIDLNTLIPAAAGWDLTDVQAVNERGQLVGGGSHNGEPHGFLMTSSWLPPGA
jgi:probable HAF family extracellular repeat protein